MALDSCHKDEAILPVEPDQSQMQISTTNGSKRALQHPLINFWETALGTYWVLLITQREAETHMPAEAVLYICQQDRD